MAEKRPNILLITSDQQHWNTLGVLNPEVQTPNLDGLAEEGTLFTRAYCPNPTCTPTRASIITGKYPSQHLAYSLGTKLPENQYTVGDHFLQYGYATALVGKAHFQPLQGTEEFPSLEAYPLLQDLEFWKDYHGRFYGFDDIALARNHTNEAHVGQHYALWMEEKGLLNWKDYFLPPTGNMDRDQKHTWDIPEEYHYNTWIAEETIGRLEKYREEKQPFFLWASFFDPHPDYLVPRPWDTMYDPDTITVPEGKPGEHRNNPPHFQMTQEENPDFSCFIGPHEGAHALHGCHSHLQDRETLKKDIAIYYGMVSMMDKYIGRILRRLDELGLKEDTIVVFTTDHGHFFGQHGLIRKGPFHYEDMIKVPFIVRYPGRVPPGQSSSALQTLVDLAPTFLTMAGLPVPREMTGVDQSGVWKGDSSAARDHIICENRHEPDTMHLKTYVNERFKITVYYGRSYGELFDLQEDPGEWNNLWDDPASQELKQDLLLAFLHGEMGKEPLWMPRVWGA